jgi:hypothetical protein
MKFIKSEFFFSNFFLIFLFLQSSLTGRPEAKDPETMAKIYDCLGSWCNIGALPLPETMNMGLLQNLFLFLVWESHSVCMPFIEQLLPTAKLAE